MYFLQELFLGRTRPWSTPKEDRFLRWRNSRCVCQISCLAMLQHFYKEETGIQAPEFSIKMPTNEAPGIESQGRLSMWEWLLAVRFTSRSSRICFQESLKVHAFLLGFLWFCLNSKIKKNSLILVVFGL